MELTWLNKMYFGLLTLYYHHGALDEAVTQNLPAVYGHMFLGYKRAVEEGQKVEESLNELEWILDNLHPRHYERLSAEYEKLKEYILDKPERVCESHRQNQTNMEKFEGDY